MEPDLAIQTMGLRKHFGRTRALRGLDLAVARGEIFGFLGPNGAGKSTTIRILLGLLRPSSGRARLWGVPAGTVASRAAGKVGALVEEPTFYEYLSGMRNLELLAGLSGRVDRERLLEVIELVGLKGREGDPVRTYSHGMKQRLGIAQSLVPRPELLILDEPASGLDPKGLVEVRDLLQRLKEQEGVTVFLSSHLLHEVELICTDVAIVNGGRVVKRERVSDLLSSREASVRIVADDAPRGLEVLEGLAFVNSAEHRDGNIVAVCPADAIADLNAALVRAGVRVSEIARQRLTLEDFYMDIMQ